jgi:hypothetical protein
MAFEEAITKVSIERLKKTIFAEHPQFCSRIEILSEDRRKEYFISDLKWIWKTDEENARKQAEELVRIGIFDRSQSRGGRDLY